MYRFGTTLTALTLVALMAAACDDDSPGPSPNPSDINFTAVLLPSNEVPPVSNAEASGSGTLTMVLHVNRDSAQNVTSATADFTVALTGFPASINITLAHIHPGAAGAVGNPIVDLGISSGQVTLTNGAGTFTRNGINVQPDVAQNIINNPASFYFNVHSSANGPGVARGQLVRQ